MSSVESSLVSSLVTQRKLQDDEDSEPDRANTDDEAGLMSKADRESLNGYQQQFEVFLTLEPPLADDGFKKYFQEMLTNLGSLRQDLKLKKKSLSRRTNKEKDPFYQGMVELEEKIKEHSHFIKCILLFHSVWFGLMVPMFYFFNFLFSRMQSVTILYLLTSSTQLILSDVC